MQISRRAILSGSVPLLVGAVPGLGMCTRSAASDAQVTYESFEPSFGDIVDLNADARLLSTGHLWSEGPTWDAKRNCLYFTDVPRNLAYRWSEQGETTIFLDPSGVAPELAGGMREPGANGLLIGQSGELLICNHGKRAVEALNLDDQTRRTLTDGFEGLRFNSPNDLIEASDGTIFFTDPPYGLEGLNESPMKEMKENGVYRITPEADIARIVDGMTFPNGVVLSPDERYLYVSQSDPEAPLIRRIDADAAARGERSSGEIWFDVRPFMHAVGGLPDGMAVAQTGHVFLGGPAGVLVIDQTARCVGRIATGRPTANCAFGEDGRTLFITSADRVVSVRTKVDGLGRF